MTKEIAVWPRDEAIRKVIRHPTGLRFENYPNGTLWPFDSPTMRLMREGAIITTPPASTKPAAAPRRRRQVMEK